MARRTRTKLNVAVEENAEVAGLPASRFASLQSNLSKISQDQKKSEKEVSVTRAALTVDELPVYSRTASGEVRSGFMVDYWCYVDEKLLLSGWVAGERAAELIRDQEASPGCTVSTFRRPDVELALPTLRTTVQGILAIVSLGGADTFRLCGRELKAPPREAGRDDRDRMWAEHRTRLGFVLNACPTSDGTLADLVAQLQAPPSMGQRARGHLEQAKGVPGCGGLVVGWTVGLPGVKFALIDSHGRMVWLSKAARWHRPDIVDAYALEFGNFTFNAGMLQGWHYPLQFGEEIRLVGFDGDTCHVLSTCVWEAAPIEPTSFARWAFDFPTSLSEFYDRLDHHDGAVIEALVSAKLASRTPVRPEITSFGTATENPRCSVIVPLYGRFDFMMNQLLEMSGDEQFKTDAELIYVVDDPRILSQVRQQAWLLYEAYRVPFQIVAVGENRGFSGANNLGVSVSRAPFVLLLNSDVIPVEPNWLGQMLAAFETTPDVGVVGARLLYANGSLQHDGMTFAWDPSWNAYLNKHPRAGMEPSAATSVAPSKQIVVTAACLMMRRSTYDDIGGLDEGYLIGDFEDSDLCLKVRREGLDIVLVKNVNLIHLERQSFFGIGTDKFREQVARFNAWRHQRRWGGIIDQLLSDLSRENRVR